jgi:hypothetical protein
MKTTNNNAKQTNNSNSCERNPLRGFEDFHMDIKDDFTDPMDNMFGFDNMEQRMLSNFKNVFNDSGLLSNEQQHPRNTNENEQVPRNEENALNNGTVISKVYCSSYNNLNGEPHQECYQSQSIKQMNNGHNISEAREAYKNSNRVMKSAYQRGLDDKGARFIKEKNTKTGVHNQHKILKGLKENEIDNFNKEYNNYSKKCGFEKNYKALNSFGPSFKDNRKQITDGNKNRN